MTDDVRLSLGRARGMVPVPLGRHYFGAETMGSEIYRGAFAPEITGREAVAALGPWLLSDTGRSGGVARGARGHISRPHRCD